MLVSSTNEVLWGAVAVPLWLLSVLYIARDASRSGRPALLWTLAAIVAGPVALLLYVLTRPRPRRLA